jgi:hypothetical protein
MADPLALQAEVDQLSRADLGTFAICAFFQINGAELQPNWHIHAMSHVLGKAAQRGPMRQLICMPPRYLKTFMGDVCLSAWLLGRDPRSKIICISYSGQLADKFSADTLRLMQTDWYQRVFPRTRLLRQAREEFSTTAGGYRMATSVGGTITGRGASVVIGDDLLNAGHAHSPTSRESTIEWFRGSVLTRFDDPQNAKFIIIGQRLHAEDPPGQLLASGGWDHLVIPAIAQRDMTYDDLEGGKKHIVPAGTVLMPSRHGFSDLEQLKREMGEHDFEAQSTSNRSRREVLPSRRSG